MKKRKKELELPETEEIEIALTKINHKIRYRRALGNAIMIMLTVSAVIVLFTMMLIPVLRIYGKSMIPTLESGDIVLSARYVNYDKGDIIAFYYNNKVLVKRVIAVAGDVVNIDKDGTVYVNNKALDEPYVKNKEKGDGDVEFPYTVPETQIFVLGDCRNNSTDSRNSEIGSVDEDKILGKIIFRVYPFDRFGFT